MESLRTCQWPWGSSTTLLTVLCLGFGSQVLGLLALALVFLTPLLPATMTMSSRCGSRFTSQFVIFFAEVYVISQNVCTQSFRFLWPWDDLLWPWHRRWWSALSLSMSGIFTLTIECLHVCVCVGSCAKHCRSLLVDGLGAEEQSCYHAESHHWKRTGRTCCIHCYC